MFSVSSHTLSNLTYSSLFSLISTANLACISELSTLSNLFNSHSPNSKLYLETLIKILERIEACLEI